MNCTHVLPRFGREYRHRKQRRKLLSVGKRRPKTDVRWAPDTYRGEMVGLLRAEGYDRTGCNLYHAEGVWEIADDFKKIGQRRSAKVVTILREPTLHVISLYEHNRNSGFDTRRMHSTLYRQPSLDEWLGIALARNFTQLGTQHNPLNMQTARLSGIRGDKKRSGLGVYPRKRDLYRDELVPDLDLALQRIQTDAFFVGITAFYRESLCLLRHKALRVLGPECQCPYAYSRASSSSFRNSDTVVAETHNRHHARYDTKTYTGSQLKLISQVTRLDRLLYGAALARFTKDLLEAEAYHSTQILCRDGTTLLRLPPSLL
eukprot:CAMPEP_0197320416 /NCGR_PEP_ID=MMETSP0891-20130614/59732_1 /TAXON_ID=44058 ORGANISM="Aureoumbra lagunensis, Strain CCMP1510" /NCGR_SAMPLE_ID=MMETSP0891 /ASSEMBLY_ACC=CAM_ASM_000534 /LENGTH=316 /DNA_ID=CAMNT_0042811793 /DNA_START=113 /DNA_END=1063 /DNA_ORIENTATION=+